MKKSTLISLFIVFIAISRITYAGTVDKNKAYLVKDGIPQGHLFIPDKSARTMMFAIKELRDYFRKITGTELPMAWRSPKHNDAGILLIVRDKAKWKGKESAQAFTIVEKTSPHKRIIITGNTELAVLYGVYQYLQGLGVKWFTPGEIGENVPKLKDIVIKKRTKKYTPTFLLRGLNFNGMNPLHFDTSDPIKIRDVIHHDYDLWLLRNRIIFQRGMHNSHWFDFNTAPKLVGGGSHGIRKIALGKADITKEPERFALVTVNGKKVRRKKSCQVCFTNEKNIQQAIKSAIKSFELLEAAKDKRNNDLDELADTFPMGLADSQGICECENCKKVAGSKPYNLDRLVWYFYNRVAKGLNEKMPGKKISLFAPYLDLEQPPVDVKIEKNIVAVTCNPCTWSKKPEEKPYYPFIREYAENIKVTRAAGAELASYDYSLWRAPQMLTLLDKIVEYKKLNYKKFHVEAMTRNEQAWPILWVLAQYAWNGNLDTHKLLKEYCYEYYGQDGGAIVYDLMQKIDLSGRQIPMVNYGGMSDSQMIMSDKLISYGRKQFLKTINKVKGKEKVRLKLFADTFEMFARSAEFNRSFCYALNRRTPKAIAACKAKYEAYEKFWDNNNISKTCSGDMLRDIRKMAEVKISPKMEHNGRKELRDKKVWLEELFAMDDVPKSVPNLFPLPEVWKFKVDFNDIGLQEGWQKIDYNDSTSWQPISTWNFFESQGYKKINGRFWYRLKFKAPIFPKGKKVLMRIGSLDDEGDIYINGKLAYSRIYKAQNDWKSSFCFDVTDFLKQGEENIIAVQGYDSSGAGGIWRPCALYTE